MLEEAAQAVKELRSPIDDTKPLCQAIIVAVKQRLDNTPAISQAFKTAKLDYVHNLWSGHDQKADFSPPPRDDTELSAFWLNLPK